MIYGMTWLLLPSNNTGWQKQVSMTTRAHPPVRLNISALTSTRNIFRVFPQNISLVFSAIDLGKITWMDEKILQKKKKKHTGKHTKSHKSPTGRCVSLNTRNLGQAAEVQTSQYICGVANTLKYVSTAISRSQNDPSSSPTGLKQTKRVLTALWTHELLSTCWIPQTSRDSIFLLKASRSEFSYPIWTLQTLSDLVIF